MFEILLVPVLTGLVIASIAGPLGCFVIWRRLAYFGDALAHSALLGVALGLMLSVSTQIGIVFTCISLALLLAQVKTDSKLSSDAWLGVLSHGSLAFSIIAISLSGAGRVDLYGYLFGDLLAADWSDFYLASCVAILLGVYLWKYWSALVSICLNEDLAKVEGTPVSLHKSLLMISIALLTAIAMKLVGALLITALLIIPAATARAWSSTPSQMAMFASVGGILALALGVIASYIWPVPTGPAIVASACCVFISSQLLRTNSQ